MTIYTHLLVAYQYADAWYAIYQGHTYRVVSSTINTTTLAPLPVC
jgi:hypothetical protein